MRRLWILLMLSLFVVAPLSLTGCSGQISQEAGDEFEEVHPEDADDAEDTEEEEDEDE